MILIFILITISTLGIIYSQLEWMKSRVNNSYREINEDLSNALEWALFHHKSEQNQEILNQLGSKFKSVYPRMGMRRKIYPDSLTIYPLKLTDRNDLSIAKGFELRRRIERVSFYLPVRRPNDLENIRRDERAVSIFDSLFSRKWDICRTRTESDSIAILKYLKISLSKNRTLIFNDRKDTIKLNASIKGGSKFSEKIKLHFWCHPGPFPQSLHRSQALEYQPSDLSYYAINPKGVRTWVYTSFGTNENSIIISRIWRQICWSVVLIIITILAYVYLFKIILKQKRLAEMKDDFINNMTHELKTPIAIISAAVEGMQNFNALQDKEKTNRYLETSRKELSRLNDLVTKVLHMASYEKKDIQLSLEKIEVDELINDIIESFKNHSDKGLNITYKNASSVKYLEADPVHFRNAVSNLVDNAIKYSGEHVDIEINCFTENKYVKFSIRDKGIGIPPSQLNQIFEKFHRVPTGNIHNVKGTGLGLSYVKYIIEMHGGTVSVKSELNKGSEFIISLPVIA